jgi:hypothetical protein
MVISPTMNGVDLFVVNPMNALEALDTSALANPSKATTVAGYAMNARLSPHRNGGVIVARGDVHWATYDGLALTQNEVWLDPGGVAVREAVFAGGVYFGITSQNEVRTLPEQAAGPTALIDRGPVLRLVSYRSEVASGIVWARSNGTIERCVAPGCMNRVASALPSTDTESVDALGFSTEHRRYVAFAGAASVKLLYWGSLDATDTVQNPSQAQVLDGGVFTAVSHAAVAGEHVFIVNPSGLRACCIGELPDQSACGEAIPLPNPRAIGASDGLVVVQNDPTGSLPLAAYDVVQHADD